MSSLSSVRFASSAIATLLLASAAGDGGKDDPPPQVQTNPDVGESRRSSTPPLKDIVPVPQKPGHVVHEVKPIPRKHAPSDIPQKRP